MHAYQLQTLDVILYEQQRSFSRDVKFIKRVGDLRVLFLEKRHGVIEVDVDLGLWNTEYQVIHVQFTELEMRRLGKVGELADGNCEAPALLRENTDELLKVLARDALFAVGIAEMSGGDAIECPATDVWNRLCPRRCSGADDIVFQLMAKGCC